MASSGRERSCTAGPACRASLALRLVFFAVAASCASAFCVLPVARNNVVGTTVTFKSPISGRQHRGILFSARAASGDLAENQIGADGGDSAAFAVAVAGGGGGRVATSKAAVAASVQKATGGDTIQVDAAAFDPAAAADEAKKTRAQAITRRAAKSVVRSLPGTWWTAGLPKWMHLVRRRMITKEDWMHLHAASGAVRKIPPKNTRLFLRECV